MNCCYIPSEEVMPDLENICVPPRPVFNPHYVVRVPFFIDAADVARVKELGKEAYAKRILSEQHEWDEKYGQPVPTKKSILL